MNFKIQMLTGNSVYKIERAISYRMEVFMFMCLSETVRTVLYNVCGIVHWFHFLPQSKELFSCQQEHSDYRHMKTKNGKQ